MGDRLAAFHAGKEPKTIPVMIETPKDMKTEKGVTDVGISAYCATKKASNTPSAAPMVPPIVVNTVDSTKN